MKKLWLPIAIGIIALLATTISGCVGLPSDRSAGELLHPSGNPLAHHFSDVKDIRTATYVVAASDSVHPYQADYRCSGADDEVEIQAALDALPDTGGEVLLLDGTFNAHGIELDSYQSLVGCGPNTVIIGDSGVILDAYGAGGDYLTSIVVADLTLDGIDTYHSEIGVRFVYVEHSVIRNVYSCNHSKNGIYLYGCDYSVITENTCQGNGIGEGAGISVTGGEGENESRFNTVTGNICQANHVGIYIDTGGVRNVIAENICQLSDEHGIFIEGGCENSIVGNYSLESSQSASGSFDNICLDYFAVQNNIQGNMCRAGSLANKPRSGLHIIDGLYNMITGNDLDDFSTYTYTSQPFIDDIGSNYVDESNRGILITQIKIYCVAKNTSGVQRVVGDVVSLKSVANGYEITAPTAIGEVQVYGMVAKNISNNAYGLVLVRGYTESLKATNAGGGNIIIGDFLITEAGVRARKAAAATDPIFARALEACAGADCTINAFINSPWD